jgi:hypothetical protein
MEYIIGLGLFLFISAAIYTYFEDRKKDKVDVDANQQWIKQWPDRQQLGVVKDLKNAELYSVIVKLEQRIYELENKPSTFN